ncbi:MAG: signal recognition particle-docking protein FtsY [Acidobacteria bacterium]|nr:signal recognition particle-docking protein FtsY [Acidobacteriota bacterium]
MPLGLRDRLGAVLRRTAARLGGRLEQIAGAAGHGADASEAALETADAIEEVLLEADVGVAASKRIMAAVRHAGAPRGGLQLRTRVQREMLEILSSPPSAPPAAAAPRVVLVVGVNGTGKTTTVGKLASLLRREGCRPLICAADTFRAAAVDQLAVWADRAGVDLVKARPGADPAAVVFDAVEAARARGRDVVLVDTAGRLHTRADLMAELEKIGRVASRAVPGAPHEVLLALDATVGQNGLTQARQFFDHAGVTGIVLTKIDGTAKGGIAVAIACELGLPIRYVGIGEALDDLLPFAAEAYVDALFTKAW